MSDVIEEIEDREAKQPSKMLMLAVLFISIAAILTPLIIARMFFIDERISKNALLTELVLSVISLLFMLLTVLLVALTDRAGILNLVWFRSSRSEIVGTILLIFAVPLFYYVTIVLMRILGLSSRWSYAYWADGLGLALFVTLTIIISVLGPILEEIFWRGYVQATLERMFGGLPALLGQAVLFGAIHLRPLGGFVSVFVFGLITGVWRWQRRTLIPVILAHMFINSLWCAAHWPDWLDICKIKPIHNYVAEFIQLSRPPAYDPNNDARGEYAKASRLVVEFPKELEDVRHRYPTQWSQEERDQAEAWVASNTKALGFVEKGTQKDYYWIEYERFNERMPVLPKNLIEMKHIIFALCLRSTLRTAQGDYELGFNDIETCCQLGKHLEANKDLFSQLVGVASRSLALENARMIIANEDINPLLMTRFQKLFENTIDCNDFDFIRDKLWVLDVVQQIFTDDGHGGGHIPRCFFKRVFFPDGELDYVLSIISMEEEPDVTAWRRLERRSTTAQVEQYYNLLERACSLSPLQYERNIEGIKTSIEQIKKTNPLIRTFSPAIDRLVHIAARARIDLDASITILRIIRCKADTQKYPDSLSQLVATGYIKNIPIDPYSDKPIIYKQTDDGFVLYSFGSDFDDDGGTPSKWGEGKKGGDQVFWPVKKSQNYSESSM